MSTYRSLYASLLAGWMCIIIISGVVFMHKEVTSTGEIVTHIHPYDFTKKTNKTHHKSDAEIQYLNIVFQSSFTDSNFATFDTPIFQDFQIATFQAYLLTQYNTESYHNFLRGPPRLA